MAGFGRLMCPLNVLRGLSVLTCSGTIIVPLLVSRLTYDHLFTGGEVPGRIWHGLMGDSLGVLRSRPSMTMDFSKIHSTTKLKGVEA
jgi:hypothetical protein